MSAASVVIPGPVTAVSDLVQSWQSRHSRDDPGLPEDRGGPEEPHAGRSFTVTCGFLAWVLLTQP